MMLVDGPGPVKRFHRAGSWPSGLGLPPAFALTLPAVCGGLAGR